MTQTVFPGNDRNSEFRDEEARLEGTVGWIDRRVAEREKSRVVSAGDVKTADSVTKMQAEDLQRLKDSRPNPYFGRVDYVDDGSNEVRTAYIGDFNSGVRGHPDDGLHPPVVHRNAPIASLYYNPAGGSYKQSDHPERKASVFLKRMLTIKDAELHDIDDALRLPSPERAPLPSPPEQSTRILNEALESAGGDYMSESVQTIQPEQYEAIATTETPVLIAQGAAGSGKSLIGPHRIDYLLSPFSDIGGYQRPSPDRVILFGPSRAFLQYVSRLLPELGVDRVRQTTVSEWLLGQFSERVALSRNDNLLNDLMNNRRRPSQEEYDAHQFKCGMKMKRLLDNYARSIANAAKRNANKRAAQPPANLSAEQFKSAVNGAFASHSQPNAARAAVIENLSAQIANAEFRAQPNRARRGATRQDFFNRAAREVESFLDFWGRIDFRTAYAHLMSSPERILRFARKGDIDLDEARRISAAATFSDSGRSLGITDLAAALYLDYALNGFQNERFQHVVVDEAQDVSPLEIELMRMHSDKDSFTILGDLRQSLLPYKSITTWNDHARLFNHSEVSRLESRTSYRSTKQITQYANRILQGLPRRAKAPIPHARNGERPMLVRSPSAADMRRDIIASARELRRMPDVHSVAVLTKWRQTASDIYKTMASEGLEGIEGVTEFTADSVVQPGIIVGPIILTKGLEFDAVIVANAGKNNYNETDFDRMLLYLACTRARHHLRVHWHGTRSPIVPEISRLAR